MAVAYMKAFIECDTDAALDAANIDAIKDMLWYYSGDDYSYSEFEDMWSSIEYDKGKVVSVKVSISGSSDSSSNTFDGRSCILTGSGRRRHGRSKFRCSIYKSRIRADGVGKDRGDGGQIVRHGLRFFDSLQGLCRLLE